MRAIPNAPCRRPAQRGFSLLETFIGITIGLFILAGVVTVFSTTLRVFASQTGMSQWQDNERTAMQMLTMVIEHAGYYYNPQTQLKATAFPATTQFPVAGQVITGAADSAGNDTVTVRYLPSTSGGSTSDFMEDCNGGLAGSGSTSMSINTFALNASHELTCAVGTQTARTLASGITSWSVLYGVDSDGDGSVNAYFPSSVMTNTTWPTVVSVQISLKFPNPLDSTTTITSVRVINFMSNS
jgi:type IV pilus assembly protein PilW